tara:strand:+ start:387 stop:956 length:570 start_codon:yes stop_codon:yes gene_type:complete
MDYKTIKNSTAYKLDKNCCTVVASSIAFNVPFEEMQTYFFKHGRKRNRGYWMRNIIKEIAKDYGYKVTSYDKINDYHYIDKKRVNTSCFWNHETNEKTLENCSITVNNCSAYLGKGTYILGVSRHVLALKNGIVEDWTKGRKHRINRIYKIEKVGKKVRRLTFAEEFKSRKSFFESGGNVIDDIIEGGL